MSARKRGIDYSGGVIQFNNSKPRNRPVIVGRAPNR
jgi:hypothetical protein